MDFDLSQLKFAALPDDHKLVYMMVVMALAAPAGLTQAEGNRILQAVMDDSQLLRPLLVDEAQYDALVDMLKPGRAGKPS